MCSQKHKDTERITASNQSHPSDSILITYYCGLMETDVSIRCERLAAIQEKHPSNDCGYVIPAELREAYMKDSTVLEGVELEYLPSSIIDTFIADHYVVDKIIELLDKRIPAPDFSEDARMYVTIKRNRGCNDYLCFDHFPYQIKYNNKACFLDGELLFLLRYYSGYYSGFDITDLTWFEELRDTVFYWKAVEQIKNKKKRSFIYPRSLQHVKK